MKSFICNIGVLQKLESSKGFVSSASSPYSPLLGQRLNRRIISSDKTHSFWHAGPSKPDVTLAASLSYLCGAEVTPAYKPFLNNVIAIRTWLLTYTQEHCCI